MTLASGSFDDSPANCVSRDSESGLSDHIAGVRAEYQFSLADEQEFVRVDAGRLVQIADSVLRGEEIIAAEISIALVGDAAMQDINRRYLNHDWPTDVISFSLQDDGFVALHDAEAGERGRCLDGEILISGETAARVAGEVGSTPVEEVALYLVHGLLHLCGYDDQNDADRTRMQSRQQSHLQKFGIQPNY